MLKGKVIYSPGNWNAGAELNYVGARYDTATQTRPLAAYDVVNLFGSYRINREFALEGRLDNLFDKAYETAWGYANPRASVFVGLRYAPK
jgi:vitamin B12 transporter